jgi:hypothetical protein
VLERLLGCHLQHGLEAEHGECLLLLHPAATPAPAASWIAPVPEASFTGTPNVLSSEHHHWPVIDEVARATRSNAAAGAIRPSPHPPAPGDPPRALPGRRLPAEQIIRQRRSAVAMDGFSSLDRPTFYRMLARTLPSEFLFDVLPWPPYVSIAVFVHRVDGLDPGLYLLVRDAAHEPGLRASLNSDFAWQRAEGCPPGLSLYLLQAGDATGAARLISCDQRIAADGAFALGMLAAFDSALETAGAAVYPRLYWECGLIGQLLYLEAEAAGLRATGIGCFFDDLMHELLGIRDRNWQSLYHFTVGGPLEDARLQTLAPYAHLDESGESVP